MIIEALTWQKAIISDIRQESSRTKTFVLATKQPYPFVAGQHLIARVTLADGFKTSRGYSMSSAPSSGKLEITIAKAEHGEVSGWFCDTARAGDSVEITDAIGSEFLWSVGTEPSLFIAGGIGVAPFMSMLRENKMHDEAAQLKLLYCAQNFEELCFKDELLDPSRSSDFSFMLTRSLPEQWQGLSGHITIDTLNPLVENIANIYICGPYQFVGAVKKLLLNELKITATIHVEKFN